MHLPLNDPAPNPADTATEHSARISTLLQELQKTPNNQISPPLLEDLIVALSRHLDHHNIPSILYGYCLMGIYGIPSEGHSDVSFAIPDDLLWSAIDLISAIPEFPVCWDEECAALIPGEGPPGLPPVAHLHLQQDLYLALYFQSRTLPNVKRDIKGVHSSEALIPADDPCLPRNPDHGRGAFTSAGACHVRIPSPTCFTQACFLNFKREVLESNLWFMLNMGQKELPVPTPSPFEMRHLSCVSYMVDYVFQEWFLDLSGLPEFYRKCLDDMFMSGDREGFRVARDRLLAAV